MKLCVLTSRFPYPIEKGDKLRIYHQLRMLSQKHQITLIALTDQPVAEEDLRHMQAFVEEIHLFSIKKWSLPFFLAKAYLKGDPLQVAYFYRPKIHQKIRRIIDDLQPDHIYCQLIRMAAYVRDIPLPKTLDYMDCFSAGMARQAEEGPAWQASIYHRESRLLFAYQQAVYDDFTFHTIISEQDRKLLDPAGRRNIQIVPNGIDTTYFQPSPKPPRAGIAFVGNMGYFPNVKAADYLVKKIMPHVWETDPNQKVIIAGARPTPQVLALAKDPRVEVTGWVEDIRDAYLAGKVFVAPIFTGSGQQNKILEAMAMGRPCFTTPLVNNAIQATPGQEIEIADRPELFAQHILRLLGDPAAYASRVQASRYFVEAYMNWARAVETLEQNFSGMPSPQD
ncbi:MAG: glycosyltransferase [Bacteroidota bacterium]